MTFQVYNSENFRHDLEQMKKLQQGGWLALVNNKLKWNSSDEETLKRPAKSDSCFSRYLDQYNVEWIDSQRYEKIEETLSTTFKVYNCVFDLRLLNYLETLAKYLELHKSCGVFDSYTQEQFNLIGFAAKGLGSFAQRLPEKPSFLISLSPFPNILYYPHQ